MKLPQKRMPAKKPKQNKMAQLDPKDITLGGYQSWGAGQPSYTLNTGAGVGGGSGNITVDSSVYGTSITAAQTISWNQDYNNWSNTGTAPVNITSDGIAMPKGSDIKVGGKSLMQAIDKIEERLGILNPNPELEDRWGQLKELRRQYIELEKDLLEKEKIMKILKEK